MVYSFISCDIILDEADVDEPVSWLSAPQDAAAKITPNGWIRIWNAMNDLKDDHHVTHMIKCFFFQLTIYFPNSHFHQILNTVMPHEPFIPTFSFPPNK